MASGPDDRVTASLYELRLGELKAASQDRLSALPTELVEDIFALLPARDLRLLLRTCKRLNRVSKRELLKTPYISGAKGFNLLCRLLDNEETGFHLARSLRWTYFDKDYDAAQVEISRRVVFPNCLVLDIEWFARPDGPVLKLRDWFPSVKALAIPHPPDGSDRWLHLPSADTTRLRSYDPGDVEALPRFFDCCASWLVQLELSQEDSGRGSLEDRDIRALGRLGPTLRRLCLNIVSATPSTATLGSLLPNLHTLEVEGRPEPWDGDDGESWNPLSGVFPKLARLRLVDEPGARRFGGSVDIVRRENTPALERFRWSERRPLSEPYAAHVESICKVAEERGVEVVRDNAVFEHECWLASSRYFAGCRIT